MSDTKESKIRKWSSEDMWVGSILLSIGLFLAGYLIGQKQAETLQVEIEGQGSLIIGLIENHVTDATRST